MQDGMGTMPQDIVTTKHRPRDENEDEMMIEGTPPDDLLLYSPGKKRRRSDSPSKWNFIIPYITTKKVIYLPHLEEAIRSNHIHALDQLENIEPNTIIDSHGTTAMGLCVELGHIKAGIALIARIDSQIILKLQENKVAVPFINCINNTNAITAHPEQYKFKKSRDATLLSIAVSKGHENFIEILYHAGATNWDIDYNGQPLQYALQSYLADSCGNLAPMIEALYKAHLIDLQQQNELGQYPLQQILELINHYKGLEQYKSNNIAERSNRYLIHIVIISLRQVAHYLIVHNQQILNLGDEYNGYTPLMHAVKAVEIGIVRLLLQNGARVNMKNHNEKTALQVLLLFFIDNKDISNKSQQGYIPSPQKFFRIAEVLVKHSNTDDISPQERFMFNKLEKEFRNYKKPEIVVTSPDGSRISQDKLDEEKRDALCAKSSESKDMLSYFWTLIKTSKEQKNEKTPRKLGY